MVTLEYKIKQLTVFLQTDSNDCHKQLTRFFNRILLEKDHLYTEVLPLVLPVLLTESVIYHTCKNLLSTKSIDNHISRVVIKPAFNICENKDAVTAKLISAFVFATQIVQSLNVLNPKFQASSYLLWLYSPVCIGPGRKPRRLVFSQRGPIVLVNSQYHTSIIYHYGSVISRNSRSTVTLHGINSVNSNHRDFGIIPFFYVITNTTFSCRKKNCMFGECLETLCDISLYKENRST